MYEDSSPQRRPSTRLSFLRAATPLFTSLSSSVRAATSLGMRKPDANHDDDDARLTQSFPSRAGSMRKRAKRIASVFSSKGRKRQRMSTPVPADEDGMIIEEAVQEEEEEPVEPVRLNFLFVGAKNSGQTSLLLWVFPHSHCLRTSVLIVHSRARFGYFPDVSSPPLAQKEKDREVDRL
jgi:Ras homolog gene family, member A